METWVPRFVDLPSLVALRPACEGAVKCEGLYVTGSLEGLAAPTVAVVGTRAASLLGKTTAYTLAADLARAGVCVVSGLAVGIDAAAHHGALAAGGATIGVLGGGHGRFFPKSNLELAKRMVQCGGGVATPFPQDRPAQPHHFLQRNGIVAGLADAVVVVEAPARSGALNTANWAAGRIPVLAVPGDVDRVKVAGCLELIRDGATLARHAEDVLAAIGLLSKRFSTSGKAAAAPPPTEPVQAAILSLLSDQEMSLDALVAQCGLSVAQVLGAVTMLETGRLIERRESGCIALASSGNVG